MIEGLNKGTRELTRQIVFDSLVLSGRKHLIKLFFFFFKELFSCSGQRWRPRSTTSALELLSVVQYMCLDFLFVPWALGSTSWSHSLFFFCRLDNNFVHSCNFCYLTTFQCIPLSEQMSSAQTTQHNLSCLETYFSTSILSTADWTWLKWSRDWQSTEISPQHFCFCLPPLWLPWSQLQIRNCLVHSLPVPTRWCWLYRVCNRIWIGHLRVSVEKPTVSRRKGYSKTKPVREKTETHAC